MSVNYADALSPYPNKGVCGISEKQDEEAKTAANVERLVSAIRSSRLVVVHSGAGISTAAGIPDFRGPRGVWTLEKQGKRLAPEETRNFDDVRPTFAHRAVVALMRHGYVHFVVTQNIDGLHLRSGVPRCRIAALHGDVFTARCAQCNVEYAFRRAVPSFGMRYVRRSDLARSDSSLFSGLLSASRDACPKSTFRSLQTELRFAGGPDRVRCVRERCRGSIRDSVLDWQDELPNADLANAEAVSRAADLNLVLGSSLQIEPSSNLPFLNKPDSQVADSPVRSCIVNLQPTRFDSRFDVRIFERIDTVLRRVCAALNVPVDEDDASETTLSFPVFLFDTPSSWTGCDSKARQSAFDFAILNVPHVIVVDYSLLIPSSCLPETLSSQNGVQVKVSAEEKVKVDVQSDDSNTDANKATNRYKHRVLNGSLLEFSPDRSADSAQSTATSSSAKKRKCESNCSNGDGTVTELPTKTTVSNCWWKRTRTSLLKSKTQTPQMRNNRSENVANGDVDVNFYIT